MSVAKITEISAQSTESFEDAIQKGIARASKTLKNIKSAWVNEQSVDVDGGRVKTWRVNMKVTFILDE
ncbi:MAG TPA: dodecin family protein [Acidobacteriota bacterium]|nr:dodecin family protein [Acidobacteriota bacterium]